MVRSFNRFMDKLSKTKGKSNNPYGHADGLLDNPNPEVSAHAQVFDRSALLATIKTDEMIRTYQKEAALLIELYDLSCKEPELQSLFQTRRAAFYAELGLTRTKNGEERKHQAELGGYISGQQLPGYGTQDEDDGEDVATQLKDLLQGLKRG